jgi:hypothetical protein
MERFVNQAPLDDYASLHSEARHRAIDQEFLAHKCAAGVSTPLGSLMGGIGQGLKRRFAYVLAGVVVIVVLISRMVTAAVALGSG